MNDQLNVEVEEVKPPVPHEADAATTTRFYLERKVVVTLATPLVPAAIPLWRNDEMVFPYEVILKWYKDRPERPWTASSIEVRYHPRLKDRSIGKRDLHVTLYGDSWRQRQGDRSMAWLAKIVAAHTPTTETALNEWEPLTKAAKPIPVGATHEQAHPVEHDGTPEATERIQEAMLR